MQHYDLLVKRGLTASLLGRTTSLSNIGQTCSSITIREDGRFSTWKLPVRSGLQMVKLELYPFAEIESKDKKDWWRVATHRANYTTIRERPYQCSSGEVNGLDNGKNVSGSRSERSSRSQQQLDFLWRHPESPLNLAFTLPSWNNSKFKFDSQTSPKFKNMYKLFCLQFCEMSFKEIYEYALSLKYFTYGAPFGNTAYTAFSIR